MTVNREWLRYFRGMIVPPDHLLTPEDRWRLYQTYPEAFSEPPVKPEARHWESTYRFVHSGVIRSGADRFSQLSNLIDAALELRDAPPPLQEHVQSSTALSSSKFNEDTCYHEACHGALDVHFGYDCDLTVYADNGGGLCHTDWASQRHDESALTDRQKAVNQCARVAAGEVGVRIKFGTPETFAATWQPGQRLHTDGDMLRAIPGLWRCEAEADAIRAEGIALAEKVLRERWDLVEDIAAKLMESGHVTVRAKRSEPATPTTAVRRAQMPLMIRSADNALSYGSNDYLSVTWTTGAAVKRIDDSGRPYFEVLELGPNNVRLDRLNGGAPFLSAHDSSRLESVLGVVVKGSAQIEGGLRGVAQIKLSNRPEVAGTVLDLRDGIIRGISVGYKYHAVTRTNEKIGDVPVWRVTDWEPMEISACAIQADAGASVRSGESFECEIRGA